MKRKYESPEMNVVEVDLQRQLLSGSGFTEGDTDTSIGTGSGTGNPGSSKSRRFDLWDED